MILETGHRSHIIEILKCRRHILLTLWHVTSIIGPARDSQIPQCICSLSHNAPFRTEMCTFLFWMVHCGIWNRCSVGFVNLVVSVLAGVIAPNGACSSAGTLFILKLVLLQLCPKMNYLWLRLLNQTTLHTRRNLTSYRITPRENVSALNNITKYVKTLSATLKSGGIHGDSLKLSKVLAAVYFFHVKASTFSIDNNAVSLTPFTPFRITREQGNADIQVHI